MKNFQKFKIRKNDEVIDVDYVTWTYEETITKIKNEDIIDPNEATIIDYQDGLREFRIEV